MKDVWAIDDAGQKWFGTLDGRVNIDDLRLLQAVKQQRAKTSLRETIARIRTRGGELDADELDALIEEARSECYELQRHSNARRRRGR